MTFQKDITNDPKYISVLDHGFVGLVDHMGSDNAIVQAARVSYGTGTKSVREDRSLIRYLLRHKHTSPFEMCQIKLHLKLPILVMRQLVRHRTASLNEYSGRYSEMTDEFYVPEIAQLKPQSTTNKQGRSGEISTKDAKSVQTLIREASENNYLIYKTLLGGNVEVVGDAGSEDVSGTDLSSGFPGLARELARSVLPVNNYTELYWTQNLHNMFHMLRLRMDGHAQWEIQEFARAIYELIQPLFPAACEAFDDYVVNASYLSGMETILLKDILALDYGDTLAEKVDALILGYPTPDAFFEHYRLTKRELDEFLNNWK